MSKKTNKKTFEPPRHQEHQEVFLRAHSAPDISLASWCLGDSSVTFYFVYRIATIASIRGRLGRPCSKLDRNPHQRGRRMNRFGFILRRLGKAIVVILGI